MKIESHSTYLKNHVINVDEIIEGHWRAEVVRKDDPTEVYWKCTATIESGIKWARDLVEKLEAKA